MTLLLAVGCARIWQDAHVEHSASGPAVDVLTYADWNSDYHKLGNKEVWVRFYEIEWGHWTARYRYVLHASDLQWEAKWASPTAVAIEFFDNPAGVQRTWDYRVDRELPRRIVARKSYTRGSDGKWIESTEIAATTK
jgi:hypothetical protein